MLGPAPAPVERIRGKFRFHLLVRAPDAHPGPLQGVLRRFLASPRMKPPADVSLQVDVDPLRLL